MRSSPCPPRLNPTRYGQRERKALAQLFAESPFRGLDIEFERLPGTLRSTDL